jgi:predicted cation transporter
MAFLACSYLCVQFLLGLRRSRFIAVLAAAALAEVVLLTQVGDDLEIVAMVMAALQLCCAAVLLFLAFSAGRAAR